MQYSARRRQLREFAEYGIRYTECMDSNCVFCKIVAGEIPAHKVYEDGEFVAFLDIHPVAPGHTLLITKEHYRFVWDVPKVGAYFEVARDIAKSMQNLFGPVDEVHSKILGDEVHHAHIHLHPSPQKAHGDKNDLEGNAQKIRSALK